MKSLLILLITLVSLNAFATDLNPSDEKIDPIKGKLESINTTEPVCLDEALCGLSTKLTISFTLTSCVNKLADLSYQMHPTRDGMNIYFNANEVLNRTRRHVRCAQETVIRKEITLHGEYNERMVRLHFIGAK